MPTYIHIKNLEKYHPGYKDRELSWCKAYFTMLNADPDFEMLCEIDKWRFLAFTMLELQCKKPVPLDAKYLKRKGFQPNKRPISLTLQMLQKFILPVTENGNPCNVEEDKEEEKDKEKELARFQKYPPDFEEFWKKFKGRWNSEKDRYVKVGKFEASLEWRRLTESEKKKAIAVAGKVSGKYVPDACRWLKRKMFDDFTVRP